MTSHTSSYTPGSPRTQRGRPRLQTSELTQTERRRAQVREAQRTYRMKKETAIRTLQARVSVLESSLTTLQTSLKKLDRQGGNSSSRSAGFYLKLINQAHDEMESIISEALSSSSEEIEASPSADQTSLHSEKQKLPSPTPLPLTTTPLNDTAKPAMRTTKNSNKKRNRDEETNPDVSNSTKIQKQEPKSVSGSESVLDNGYPKIKIEPLDYDAPFLLSPSSASSSPLGVSEEENRSDMRTTFDPLLLLIKNEPSEDNGATSSSIMYQRKKQESEELLQQFHEYNNNTTSMPLSDTNLGFSYTYGDDPLESQQQVQYEQSIQTPMQQQVDIMDPANLEFSGLHQRILAVDSFDLFAL